MFISALLITTKKTYRDIFTLFKDNDLALELKRTTKLYSFFKTNLNLILVLVMRLFGCKN